MNPSFEDTIHCPLAPADFDKCVGWTSYGGTPDYMNACSSGAVSVPNNWGGYQQAASGNAYFAFASYHSPLPNHRELIGGNLTSPLVIGTKYFASLKVALSISSPISTNTASNKMGAMFSTVAYSSNNSAPLTNNPPIYTDSIVTDTINWTIISGSFIADSAYTHIIIGNFFSDSLTDTLQLVSGFYDDAYYYVDDICVSTDSLGCDFASSIQQTKQNTEVSLFPNPFSNQLTFSLADNEQTTVSLYNFLGQQVLQQTFTNTATINTEQLANGIYFCELRNSKGALKTGKVVKQ